MALNAIFSVVLTHLGGASSKHKIWDIGKKTIITKPSSNVCGPLHTALAGCVLCHVTSDVMHAIYNKADLHKTVKIS